MLAIRVQQTVADRHRPAKWSAMTASGTLRAGLPTLDRDQRSAIRRPLTRHLPTRLLPADLLRIADQGPRTSSTAATTRCCRRSGTSPPVRRSVCSGRDDLELWLVSWVDDGESELHDHAGSLGALTVMSGSLREYHWTGDDLGYVFSVPVIRLPSRSDGCTI